MITRNENGSVIVIAIMILAVLTILGTATVRTSITEQQISTNMLIYKMNFYGAESALAHGKLWANANIDPTFDADSEIPWIEGELSNSVAYAADIVCLDTIEPTSKMPNIQIAGYGTHTVRDGLAVVRATYTFTPAFQLPGAPIRTYDDALKIQGSPDIDADYNLCSGEDTPPEIVYDVDNIDYNVEYIGGSGITCTAGCDDETSLDAGMDIIQWGNMRANVLNLAKEVHTTMPVDMGTENKPTVVFIDATTPVSINGGTGWGVLFIDGNVEKINGIFTWNGPVIINGNIIKSITGNVTINGSLMLNNDEDVAVEVDTLTGTLGINYDCELLNSLFDKLSGYRLTSWKQM